MGQTSRFADESIEIVCYARFFRLQERRTLDNIASVLYTRVQMPDPLQVYCACLLRSRRFNNHNLRSVVNREPQKMIGAFLQTFWALPCFCQLLLPLQKPQIAVCFPHLSLENCHHIVAFCLFITLKLVLVETVCADLLHKQTAALYFQGLFQKFQRAGCVKLLHCRLDSVEIRLGQRFALNLKMWCFGFLVLGSDQRWAWNQRRRQLRWRLRLATGTHFCLFQRGFGQEIRATNCSCWLRAGRVNWIFPRSVCCLGSGWQHSKQQLR